MIYLTPLVYNIVFILRIRALGLGAVISAEGRIVSIFYILGDYLTWSVHLLRRKFVILLDHDCAYAMKFIHFDTVYSLLCKYVPSTKNITTCLGLTSKILFKKCY